jgi:hypothetical protein
MTNAWIQGTTHRCRRWSAAAIWACLTAASALADETPAPPPLPQYAVLRAAQPPTIDGKLDDPCWFAAPDCGPLRFTWYAGGPQEQTIVKLLWDDERLYIAHLCQDAFITARYTKHDDPVPEDDCFEIMLAPDAERGDCYFNVEWNVLGAYVDGHRPAGPTGPREPWDVAGMQLAGSCVGTLNEDGDRDGYWIVEVAIPWKNFAGRLRHFPPRPGDALRANFNRHGGQTNFQYSQWSSGDTPTPAFHTPHRFGTLVLSDREAPFAPPHTAP